MRTKPGTVARRAVTLAATAQAVAGTPQRPATGKVRGTLASRAGPPLGPVGLRVSSSRQGVSVCRRRLRSTWAKAPAWLLAGLGSSVPAGRVRLAVFETWRALPRPVTVPIAVKVTEPPAGRFTVALRFPLPEGGQVPPPAPVQLQVTPVRGAVKV